MTSEGIKPIFFTSDWHVGEETSMRFDNRPFSSLEHMHECLINNFNKLVPEDGLTYFLGDMGYSKDGILANILSALNGTKVLILGNHDRGSNNGYCNGFDVVLNEAVIYICNQKVSLTHCPLRGILREDCSKMRGHIPGDLWHGESRHLKFSREAHSGFHLHGHIHSPNKGQSKKILDHQYDVGLPANHYKPVSHRTIESWITKCLVERNKLK